MPVSRSGQLWPIGSGSGVRPQDRLTMGSLASQYPDIPDEGLTVNALADRADAPKINYLWYVLGIVIVLVALKYASEHERSGMDPKIAGIGVYNYVVIGTMAMLFIVTGKVILNKYPVKGLTEIFNAA